MRTVMVKSSDCPIWNSGSSLYLQTWPTRAHRPVRIQSSAGSFEFDTAQMNACSPLPEKTMKKCCCRSSNTKNTTSITKMGASPRLLAIPTTHADRPLRKSRMGNTGTFLRSSALGCFADIGTAGGSQRSITREQSVSSAPRYQIPSSLTAISSSASYGSTEVLEHILCHDDCDVDLINSVGRKTPLHLAVQLDDTDRRLYIINSLLDAGADRTYVPV
jgi:hypothetical protein